MNLSEVSFSPTVSLSGISSVPMSKDNQWIRENLDLRIRVASLENQLTKLLNEKCITESTISNYMDEIKNSSKALLECRNLNEELLICQQKIIGLENDLKRSKESENNLKQENISLHYTLTVLESKNGTNYVNHNDYQAIKLQNSKIQQEISIMESKNAELVVENLQIRSKLKSIETNGLSMKAELESAKNIIQGLETKLKATEEQRIDLLGRYDNMLMLNQSHEGILYNKEEEIRRLLNTIKVNDIMLRDVSKRFTTDKLSSIFMNMNTIEQKLSNLDDKLQRVSFKASSIDSTEETRIIINRLLSLISQGMGIEPSKIPTASELIRIKGLLDGFSSTVENMILHKKPIHYSDDTLQLIHRIGSSIVKSSARMHEDHVEMMKTLLQNKTTTFYSHIHISKKS